MKNRLLILLCALLGFAGLQPASGASDSDSSVRQSQLCHHHRHHHHRHYHRHHRRVWIHGHYRYRHGRRYWVPGHYRYY